ncbi:hypothetical protein DFH11DRAFT_851080 [Phellopilus nigrolimitatus]|nr:hypothetical protein DFH11DRAFT_851080 [Phellopilus nigrolimitatus]
MPPNFQRSGLPPNQFCFFPPRLQMRMSSYLRQHQLRLHRAKAGAVGVGVAGASDTLDVDLDAYIINTKAADDGVSDGIVTRPKRQQLLGDGHPAWCSRRDRRHAARMREYPNPQYPQHDSRAPPSPRPCACLRRSHAECCPGEFTHARACAPASACCDVCRRGRRDCGSSMDLACSQRRGRVEPRVSRSSDARCHPPFFSPPSRRCPRRPPTTDNRPTTPRRCPCLPRATHRMSVSPVPDLPATAPHSGSTISTTTATKSPPELASIVKSATPPSLPQLPPSVAVSPPALRRTSPTQSRDEDQSMSDSKPALASPPPPPTFSHTALPTSTASAIAGSPGSSASPKPLHSNSTSSPLLNHAAQLTAAQAPSQLALLLSSALADVDALRRELTVAQSRATRAERLLVSVQGLSSRDSPDPDEEKTNGEREREKDVKAESQVPESAVKAVLDAEARAERPFACSSPSSNGTSTRARSDPLTRAPLLRASSRQRRTSPWLTPVTRPPPLPRARIFSTNKGTTPSACLPFPCRTPPALRPPEIACSPVQKWPRAGGAAQRRVRKGLRWEEVQGRWVGHGG